VKAGGRVPKKPVTASSISSHCMVEAFRRSACWNNCIGSARQRQVQRLPRALYRQGQQGSQALGQGEGSRQDLLETLPPDP